MIDIAVSRVSMTLLLTLPTGFFSQPEQSTGLAQRMAAEVERLRLSQGLSYYPALDYWIELGGLPSDLLIEYRRAGKHAKRYSEQRVRRSLGEVFSQVKILDCRSPAYGLPQVRPGRTESQAQLAEHLRLDRVRIVLALDSIVKGQAAGRAGFARHQALRWLKDGFAQVEVRTCDPSR